MKRYDGKLAMLRQVEFLHDSDERVLRKLASQIDEICVNTGQVLAREGRSGFESFVVVEGWAEVSSNGVTFATIGPGEFIGEMALVEGTPRNATVVATTPMTLLVLDPSAFRDVIKQPEVALALEQCLQRRAG